jgi:hypothetical protein
VMAVPLQLGHQELPLHAERVAQVHLLLAVLLSGRTFHNRQSSQRRHVTALLQPLEWAVTSRQRRMGVAVGHLIRPHRRKRLPRPEHPGRLGLALHAGLIVAFWAQRPGPRDRQEPTPRLRRMACTMLKVRVICMAPISTTLG